MDFLWRICLDYDRISQGKEETCVRISEQKQNWKRKIRTMEDGSFENISGK